VARQALSSALRLLPIIRVLLSSSLGGLEKLEVVSSPVIVSAEAELPEYWGKERGRWRSWRCE
jgi:hypothetical protein